ncbi:MAG: nicotinate-nucleotide--dimethylbenzimidazole phosphoribosyltransferase [Betaproteobacteria bacterium]|jgi:nicotinate-nucleotide--dimethylbenzimidazole phosphoribosyltransferase|nr:nicotinate-nucleotide--dimethylbenzimidazole phosphoribosyltransferase [Betaproteobacteria bacterium]
MIPDWISIPISPPQSSYADLARQRQNTLTKPPGSLGQLEDLACFMAAAQGTPLPQVDPIWISIFAGDHGITAENISAFPAVVTGEMIKNFSRGGAAISVLARTLGAHLEVVDLGTIQQLSGIPGVRHVNLGPGTANFHHQPAMCTTQCALALEAGRNSARLAKTHLSHLFIAGEMGIGNTTTATALACALLNIAAVDLAGPGTGLPPSGVAHKVKIIEESLIKHKSALTSPFEILRHLGGFEIAALVGALLGCAQEGLPILVDGFIVSVAALLAQSLNPGIRPWLLFGHCSAEPGHRHILDALHAQPLLSLGLRLGEGSGAAIAVPLLRLACTLHQEMATFAEASVSQS